MTRCTVKRQPYQLADAPVWYRYDDPYEAGGEPYQLADAPVWYRYDDPYEAGGEPYLQEFRVARETPKCVVLDHYGDERRVLKEARRRFAYPTKELALQSYLIRKARQIGYAAVAHDRAKDNRAAALGLASSMGLELRGERLVPASG